MLNDIRQKDGKLSIQDFKLQIEDGNLLILHRRDHNNKKIRTSQMTRLGTSLLKGAGALWKQGREKVNTILQGYQSEQEGPSVPKWMHGQQRYAAAGRRAEVTKVARALEARRGRNGCGVHLIYSICHRRTRQSLNDVSPSDQP
jgi:hypothetical protein